METERFSLNSGRERPPYKPKDIHCPSCGAGLTVKDEHAELVVCDYCGSHLDVTKEEKTVLGKGSGQKWEFPLQLGDSFRRKGARYEIIGRMVFIEDNDYDELTRQYLLYNPRHGTLWLDEYQGQYSLSNDSHVMPTSDPFTKRRGDILKTYDNREWVTEGLGTYELVYVDGALPWIAKVGDQVHYAEFVNKTSPKLQYEAQRIANEIEYGSGEALTLQQVRRATEKPEMGGTAKAAVAQKRATNVAEARKWYVRIIAIALIAVLFNGILALYSMSTGSTALTQHFPAAELTGETYSKPFEVLKANDLLKITANSNLNNAWMALDIAVVWDQDETVIHVDGADISYYQGVEDGESWSEGSRSKSIYIRVPKAGTYRLLLHAVSAGGNTTTASTALHDVNIKVVTGALMPHYFIAGAIFSGVILILILYFYQKWKGEEDED